MVFEPCLPIAPPNPTTSEKIQAGNNNSNRTDDAKRMSRFTETPRLPNA